MTEQQKEVVSRFRLIAHGIVPTTEEDVFAAFGVNFHDRPDLILDLIERARRDRRVDDFGCALRLLFVFRQPPAANVPLLNELLLEDWHDRNEEIARVLEGIKDPRSVDSLYHSALTEFKHVAYDGDHNIARKCTWALARIATPEAVARLQQLAQCSIPQVCAYAQKRLPKSNDA